MNFKTKNQHFLAAAEHIQDFQQLKNESGWFNQSNPNPCDLMYMYVSHATTTAESLHYIRFHNTLMMIILHLIEVATQHTGRGHNYSITYISSNQLRPNYQTS